MCRGVTSNMSGWRSQCRTASPDTPTWRALRKSAAPKPQPKTAAAGCIQRFCVPHCGSGAKKLPTAAAGVTVRGAASQPPGAVQSRGDRRAGPTSQTPPDPPRGLETSAPGRGRGRGVAPHGPAAQTQTTAAARGPGRYQPRDAGPAERWPTAARSPTAAAATPRRPPPPFPPKRSRAPLAPRRPPPLPPPPRPLPAPASQAPLPRHRGQRDAPTGSVAQSGRGTTEEGRARAGRLAGRRAGRGARRPGGEPSKGQATTGRVDRSRPAATGRRAAPAPPRSPGDAPEAPDCAVAPGGSRGRRQRGRCVAGGTSVPRNPRPPNLEGLSAFR
ncbi:basic proline-rich protein-like [Cervus elaphus]|uniref:basic proline-rich protein-like n=1 Tax=Cervus elaphus TaxID=9860 RepID=UPI001CC2C121|nr:basic proline-rich protein-like [Cervus elaphus]